jgi:hypothetical protein
LAEPGVVDGIVGDGALGLADEAVLLLVPAGADLHMKDLSPAAVDADDPVGAALIRKAVTVIVAAVKSNSNFVGVAGVHALVGQVLALL